jgi:hypothetical protein
MLQTRLADAEARCDALSACKVLQADLHVAKAKQKSVEESEEVLTKKLKKAESRGRSSKRSINITSQKLLDTSNKFPSFLGFGIRVGLEVFTGGSKASEFWFFTLRPSDFELRSYLLRTT